MCAIKIMESIWGSTTFVVNIYDNIGALRLATIRPEAVKSRWKQVHLMSRLSGVYQSMESGMSFGACLRTPEYQETVANLNNTSKSQRKTGFTSRTYYDIISILIGNNKYNINRNIVLARNTRRINILSYIIL